MAGSYQVMENLRAATGIPHPQSGEEGMHEPVSISPDGNYSIEFVECLASCGTAPVCMVNEQLHENVRPEESGNLLSSDSKPRYVQPPHPLEHRLVFQNIGRQDWTPDIECYLNSGGYEQEDARGYR
jgi:hypothetical protein